MHDIVIRAEGVTKTYPLEASTRRRLLYVLGFERSGARVIETKAAVDGLDFEIRRGEKVGIIGRNGSGKSTLLGMISGTIEPTQGKLSVTGDIHALLQLGAGFNEDLTGRENAYSYLALQGVSGAEAERRVREIIEFAEIGVYFDQPIKTYSSGMRLRLMFAAATTVKPDILILDEVLSVGDAYFIGKSFERMRALSSDRGTTLLVVSHAVNMLPELCDRILWVDNGAIRMDGDPETVARAYDNFIRTEEENRLRRQQGAKPVRQLSVLPGEHRDDTSPPPGDSTPAGVAGEIRMADGQPPRDTLVVRRIEFLDAGEAVGTIDVGDGADAGDGVLLLDHGVGNWGDVVTGMAGRAFLPFGSPFHKLPFLVTRPGFLQRLEAGGFEARLHCTSQKAGTVLLRLFDDELSRCWQACFDADRVDGAAVLSAPLQFLPDDVPVAESDSTAMTSGRFGTRRIEFLDVEFLGEGDLSRLVYSIGSLLRVRLRYRINDPALDENAEVVLAFQKDGLQITNRFFLDEYRFCAATRSEGEIFLDASPLLLAQGEYVVSVAVHAAGHATRKTPREHVSVSHAVYDMFYRVFHITVFEPYHTTLLKNVIFQHPAKWTVDQQEIDARIITD